MVFHGRGRLNWLDIVEIARQVYHVPCMDVHLINHI
jgi:hypothetical protein